MDKIRQYQVVNEIKPRFKRLVKPFNQSSPIKIKFIEEEYKLQYQEMGLWTMEDEHKTKKEKNKEKKIGGGTGYIKVVDLAFWYSP